MDPYARKNTEWEKKKKKDQEDYTKYATVYNF